MKTILHGSKLTLTLLNWVTKTDCYMWENLKLKNVTWWFHCNGPAVSSRAQLLSNELHTFSAGAPHNWCSWWEELGISTFGRRGHPSLGAAISSTKSQRLYKLWQKL
jgi:hypothetical protein